MKKDVSLWILTSLFTGSIYAGNMGTVIQKPEVSWVSTISMGPVWENAGTTQTFYLTPAIEKTYKANKSSHALFNGEFFLGIQKTLSQAILGQLGLAVATTSHANLSGIIWDDADPLFDNHTYSYKTQNNRVIVKGKLLAEAGYWFTPWLSGGVGAGFNRSSSFNNIPRIFEALPNSNFASHTNTSFTYTVGAGVQKALTRNWQIGVGYEFADWGKSELGRAAGQHLNSGLAMNHLYTNGILLNITYLS